MLRSPPSPSFFKSTVYQRDISPPQQVTVYIQAVTLGPFLHLQLSTAGWTNYSVSDMCIDSYLISFRKLNGLLFMPPTTWLMILSRGSDSLWRQISSLSYCYSMNNDMIWYLYHISLPLFLCYEHNAFQFQLCYGALIFFIYFSSISVVK